MGYEIDFLSSGEKTTGGDVIAIRYGNLFGERDEWKLVVVDGGYTGDGERMVEHIRRWYSTDRVDLVVSTHPDDDHASGLLPVIRELDVGLIWMHKSWDHCSGIEWHDGRVTDNSVSERLKRSLNRAREIERLANRKPIRIEEPFRGEVFFDGITVLGPTRTYYESLLPEFRSTPETAAFSISRIFEQRHGVTGLLSRMHRVEESIDTETLTNDGKTSAENNSSAILLFNVDDGVILLTADAGIPALEHVVSDPHWPIYRSRLKVIQIPHHGSRHNVGPSILDELVGPKQLVHVKAMSAYVSCPKRGFPRHPSPQVTNAFYRRGASVYATQGSTKRHHHNAPSRDWSAAKPLPFYEEIEVEA